MTTPDDPTWTEQEIEARANEIPPYFPPLPGIEPISQDPGLFADEHAQRFGVTLARAAVAGTAAAMIAAAVALLGMGEHPANHNAVTVKYNAEVARIGDGPWCDMGITVEAINSGNIDAVCGGPRRGFAYTPAHAADFKRRGVWHAGLHGIKPGDIVFFNWSRKKGIDDVEHVGIVEHVYADGTVATVECNISDACRREHRDSTYVVGYGRPPYSKQEEDMPIRTSLSINKAQDLKWGEFVPLNWGIENADPKDAHTKANPGYVAPVSSWADFDASVRLEGLAEGDEYQLRYEVHDWADGKSKGAPWTEIHADAKATNGAQFVPGSCSKGLTKGQHAYVAVAVFPADPTSSTRPVPKATAGRWTVRQDQS